MSREDSLSSRFDYLFEPLDDEESIDADPDGRSGPAATPTTAGHRRAPHQYGWPLPPSSSAPLAWLP
jgi:hypothetical protein